MSPKNLAPHTKTCLVFCLHSIFEESLNKDLFFHQNLKGRVIWWINSDPLEDVGLFPILKL